MTGARLDIEDLQKVQNAVIRTVAAFEPGSSFEGGIRAATVMLHGGVVKRAHVDTGAMKAAELMQVSRRGTNVRGEVFVSPSATNPRTRQKVIDYAGHENARGGSHAFYELTFKQDGPKAAETALEITKRGLPK